MNRRGFVEQLALIIVLALIIIGGIAWVHYSLPQKSAQNDNVLTPPVSTQSGISTTTTTNQSKTENTKAPPLASGNDVNSLIYNTFYNTSTWKEFDSTIGHFKASFPVYPSHTTTPVNLPGLNQTMYLETYGGAQSDGTTYAVNFVAYPQQIDTSIPQNNLDGSVNGSVQTTGGTLMSSNLSHFLNYPSIDYLIRVSDMSDPSGYAYMKGRNLLVGHDLYQILIEYEGKDAANVQFDKFVNSFQLL